MTPSSLGLPGMSNDEEKAALLELLSRQHQANQMQLNALANNLGAGSMSSPPAESQSYTAANNNATAFQMNNMNNIGMNAMMMNNMMNSGVMNNQMVGMNMGMDMNRMNSNLMNFPQQAMLASSVQQLPMVQLTQEDPGWEEQFFALKAYQRGTGHCKVPARYKANPKLGRWVMTQRRQFTLLMQGYPSALTAERIQRLESIGFTWSIRPEPIKTWNRKFQELKVYKNTFGNCMVPQRYQGE